MSQELSITPESSFQPDCVGLNPRAAFMTAIKKMQAAGEIAYVYGDIKGLLNISGFSQNGRNRFIRLSSEEINTLCEHSPKDKELWRPYVSETQTLLSKMDHARKVDSCLGRPYVTTQLAGTVSNLTRLRYLHERGFSSVQASKMRDLLAYYNGGASLARLICIGQSANEQTGESILIQSAIQFLELYRNELIMPPHLKRRQTFDEYTLHEIETGDFRWMDDGGNSVWEDIRDLPLFTLYDAMPDFSSVADWFITAKPVFDNNQIKRGWMYLEESSRKWHQDFESYGFSKELLSEYPSWNCLVADRQEAWLAIFPPDNPYRIIPVTTPQQLIEESQTMHHCVVTYIDDCIGGHLRIFSVRDAVSNQRIATAALSMHSDKWELVQLKGKHNQELIHRAYISNDPLAIVLDALVNWYNAGTINICLKKSNAQCVIL